MKKPALSSLSPIPESTYTLSSRGVTQVQTEQIKASRIGVNESGALLIMKQNPATLRHEPVRILAAGNWSEIELLEATEK